MAQPLEDAGDGNEGVHTSDTNTNSGDPEEAAFQWPTLNTEAERRNDAAKRSPWGVAATTERKINYILEGTPGWTRNGKYGPPSYVELPTDLKANSANTNNLGKLKEQQEPFTAVDNACNNNSDEAGLHGKQETGRKRRTAKKRNGEGNKKGATISSTPATPAEPEKSHTWSWAVGDQKQELRELEETLEIENMEMEEVLFRYPIGEDNLVVEASRGLGELSIGQHDDETAVHKRTCHLAETESLFLTKGDYMGTRRYRDCSDRQLMFWWHWMKQKTDGSGVAYFSTLEYGSTAGKGGGPNEEWAKQGKTVDVFSKKLIFVPVHERNHYSLFVVVNCGAVCAHSRRLLGKEKLGVEARDCAFPCLLHLDSKSDDHHSVAIAGDIRVWLDKEWRRKYPEDHTARKIFKKKTMFLSKPRVPQQPDGYGCSGYYVCRFMYNMYQQRNMRFSYSETGMRDLDLSSVPEKGLFPSVIADNKLFRFDKEDIKNVRRNFATLILRLGCLYESNQMDEMDARMKRRKAVAQSD